MYVKTQPNTESLHVEGESKHARHKVAKLVKKKMWDEMKRDGDEQKERRKVSSESEIESEWEIWIKWRFTTLLTNHQTWIQQIKCEASHERYKILKIFSKLLFVFFRQDSVLARKIPNDTLQSLPTIAPVPLADGVTV